MCVKESLAHVYENPENSSLKFSEFTPAMEPLREKIFGKVRSFLRIQWIFVDCFQSLLVANSP
jgi:hypothetical protein